MDARIAVVGDYHGKNPTHGLTNAALDHLGLGFDWVPTEVVSQSTEKHLEPYHGLWIAPGSPYSSMDGALGAIRYARERAVPLVGT